MRPFFIIAFLLVLALAWFKFLDWEEKRNKKEAAKSTEEYHARRARARKHQ